MSAAESAAESAAAVDRVAAKREELGAVEFGAYAFMVLGLLAHQAPEVVEFLLTQADRQIARASMTVASSTNYNDRGSDL